MLQSTLFASFLRITVCVMAWSRRATEEVHSTGTAPKLLPGATVFPPQAASSSLTGLLSESYSPSRVMVTFDYLSTLIQRAELLRLKGQRIFEPGRGVRHFGADASH